MSTDAIGLIGTHCICNIICFEGIDTKNRDFLNSFYFDVGENAGEQVMRTAEDCWKAEYFNQIEWIPSRAILLQRLLFELKNQIKEETI